MTNITEDASIDDLEDDLQLHQVILQSLNEQRPNAVEEIQEILDVIRDLETRLARLRRGGQATPQTRSPVTSSGTPKSPLSQAQLDGAAPPRPNGALSPPQWGSSAMSPPRRPYQRALDISPYRPGFSISRSSSYGHDDDDLDRPLGRGTTHMCASSSSAMSSSRKLAGLPLEAESSRKRRRQSSSGDLNFLRPQKRATDDRRPSSSSTASSSTPQSQLHDESEELKRLLGLDSDDTLRALQEEQRKAEKWLEERKEQERRDEEYARMLMNGMYEPPRPASAHSTASTNYSRSSIQLPSEASLVYRGEAGPSSIPEHRSINTPLVDRLVDRSRSSYSIPSTPESGHSEVQHLPLITLRDSDDSDIAEISPQDFHSGQSRPQSHHRLYPSYNTHPGHSSNRRSVATELGRYVPVTQPSIRLGYSAPQGSVYGPNVLQNTMARLQASRQMLQQAGRSVFEGFSSYFLPSGSSGLPTGLSADDYYASLKGYSDFYEPGVDPKQVQEEIKQLLETIRPDTEIAKEKREGTPEALRYTLLEHQKLGLTWMKTMEESEKKGGILADDMGLGKTIQAIALIVSRPSTDPERKPTLIVAPVSLMQQWKREIQKAVKPGRHQLSVYVLHGDKRVVSYRDMKDYDVVLTTFGTLSSELKHREKYDELQSAGANEEALSRTLLKNLPCLGPSSLWHRVIIDEAQCIKNRNTRSAQACCRLNSTYRWCMSGTPMMNTVEELHSLLKFLRIRPYSSLDRFNKDFTRPLKGPPGESRDKAMQQLQVLVKAVLLRRTKTSKIDGQPILRLPPRVLEKVYAVFSEDEQAIYDALESKTQVQFNKYLKANAVGRNYSNILVLLLRLRQACCHPHLMTDFSVEVNAATDELDLVANAKAFGDEVVVRLKENENLECPICIDAVDNPIIFFPCGHSACAECFSRMTDPSLAVQRGEDGAAEIKCPNCRGRVDPRKVTDHLTFKKVHSPDADDLDQVGSQKPIRDEEDDDDSDDDDDDDDDDNSLSRFIVDDEDDSSSVRKSKTKKGKKAKKTKKSLAELKKEASKNIKSKQKYLRRLEKTWVTSAKIEKTLEILQEIQDREDSEKTIIFSQFTALLDLLEVPIVRRGWGYRRYDGSMRPGDRNAAVLEFTDNPDCKIMLVSLKAGNAGLNLVAASQVIIFDPFWNPYVEDQAIDRAHRIGQMRQVHIHRILVQKTVEDRILELQEKKREIIDGALDEKAQKKVSRLGTQELAYLFGVR
ncbi:hypothetical protein KXX13_007896 [Aspergillus fumigatus]|nr:hypothetical protein CNMCM8714_002454 [Aspergillus fumigatus]KAH1460218.1 hypothetical protein KXX13_007896 [Aspergillus fumigatus]KAH1523239.1 hypothetical protein KXX29_008446 [Aspergillus fumigatus]KAH1536825.1 hypothetical protein KXX18_000139 [Aspergillus fumigatus]KAH1605405.1 hypothetical protein KXX44_001631 [Aspergillus fumigatus]